MTDSTIDNKSSEGDLELNPSMEELFGEIEDESLEGVDRGGQSDASTAETRKDDAEDVEDVTAADVFSQLRAEVSAADGMNEVLEDESPEDIIASADQEADEPDRVDDDLVDETALDDLLLTGRTKGEEFLWVDSGASDDETNVSPSQTVASDDAPTDDDPTTTQREDAPEGDRQRTDDPDPEPTTDATAGRADYSLEAAVADAETDAGVEADPEPDADSGAATDAVSKGAADVETDTDAETTENALVVSDVESNDTELVSAEEDDSSGGFLSWLRSKLPF